MREYQIKETKEFTIFYIKCIKCLKFTIIACSAQTTLKTYATCDNCSYYNQEPNFERVTNNKCILNYHVREMNDVC